MVAGHGPVHCRNVLASGDSPDNADELRGECGAAAQRHGLGIVRIVVQRAIHEIDADGALRAERVARGTVEGKHATLVLRHRDGARGDRNGRSAPQAGKESRLALRDDDFDCLRIVLIRSRLRRLVDRDG